MKLREKILCVDDDAINRATFLELLEEEYDIGLAVDGPDALAKIGQFRPDLVLLDIMMPGMNGYEVCQKIREAQRTRHTKIIMISAKAMVSERLAGYESGADDYLTKPFDHEELLAKIRVHLRLRASEEAEEVQASVMSSLGSRTSTPLSGILGPLELVLSGDELDFDLTESRSMIESAYQSARSLQNLFTHVLKLTSLKSRQVDFVFDRETIVDFLNVVTSEFAGEPLDLELAVEEECEFTIDHDELTEAVRPLIESALARNPEGERVVVRAELIDDEVHIEIRDSGPTLDPTEVSAAFDGGSASYESSLGLRLSVAQQLVWSHGGEIVLRSSEEHGNVYQITLPHQRVTA